MSSSHARQLSVKGLKFDLTSGTLGTGSDKSQLRKWRRLSVQYYIIYYDIMSVSVHVT